MENILLEPWDFVTLVVYFVAVLMVGLYAMWKANRTSVAGYFLADNTITWWPAGLSMFASNIGSEHFIGLAGKGAAAGIAAYLYEINAIFCLLALGWIFLPTYLSAQISTIPGYLNRRFGRERLRLCMSLIALLLYIFVKVSVDLYAGALFIQQALAWNIYWSIAGILAITALYTVAGGLKAVIYTDSLQTLIMIVGATILMALSFIEVGGYAELYRKYMMAIPNSTLENPNTICGYPRDDAFHLVRDSRTADYPFAGTMFRSTVGAIWYWCCDQILVQRGLATKSLHHAQGGSVLASYLKVLPLFLLIFPGMISRALYPDDIGCADPGLCTAICDNKYGCSDIAYPLLVLRIMPAGLRGVMMAVMLSALMSSLTSIFNSAGTIFTLDLWTKFRPQASQREEIFVGRIFVVLLAAFGFAWVPVMQITAGGELMDYIFSVTTYLSTPVSTLFIAAVLWPRLNEQAAFGGFIVGLVFGFARMLIEVIFPAPHCGEVDSRPVGIVNFLSSFHFTYYSMLIFGVELTAMVVISILTKPMTVKELEGVTFFTRRKPTATPAEFADSTTEKVPIIDKGSFSTREPASSWIGTLLNVNLSLIHI